jgi:drug/metabolite transporter (DMT)-like permease
MIGEIFALLGAFSVGSAGVAVRRGMRNTLDNGVFITISIGTVVYLILVGVLYAGDLLPPLTFMGFVLFVLAGLLTSFMGRSLHFAAIRTIGPSRATAFRAGSPAITVLLAFTFLSERFTPLQLVGAISIIGGVIMLSRETVGRTDLEVARDSGNRSGVPGTRARGSLVGVLYGVLAAMSFGVGHYLRKIALQEVPSPLWGLMVGTTSAWLALVIQARLRGTLGEMCKNNFNFHAPPWFFILGGILTTAGQTLVFFSIHYTAVSTAMVLGSSDPLATLFISRVFLGREEPLNGRVIACSSAICCGIILMILF